MSTCAAFVKESRMKFANATKFNRKSGAAKWRDLLLNHSPDALSSVTNERFSATTH
jgi:hypothetical protein